MKVTEKMAKIIRDRIANSELNAVFSTDVEQMIEDAIKKIELLPNIEEVRLMLAGEKAKLQAFGEDSRRIRRRIPQHPISEFCNRNHYRSQRVTKTPKGGFQNTRQASKPVNQQSPVFKRENMLASGLSPRAIQNLVICPGYKR